MKNIRSLVFWLKDTCLSHGIVKKTYSDVQRSFSETEENIEQLSAILKWATEEVPFYRKFKGKSIEEFPVVNKNVVRDGGDDFLATCMKGQPLHEETTSGSTGTPFRILQDKGKRLRASADSLVMSDFAGFHLGTRLYYVRVWNDLNRKGWLGSHLKNIVMQDSDNLSDEALEKWLVKMEKDKSEKSVLAYSSSLIALEKWMTRTGRKTTAKVACFITMSESMPADTRKVLSQLFGCPVVSRYSNQECGLMSQQCAGGDEYHINTRSFYVEILDMDKDEPVPDGVKGRIVVTDLYNRAMPLIRYDTGDIGAISHSPKCGFKGKVFTSIEGRKVDCIYSTKGDMLSPVTIINAMWFFNDLLQYQFIQQGDKEYEVKLNSSTPTYYREDEVVSEMKKIVGEDAFIKITYVDEIPMLNSGKRKQVVNNYKK